MRCSRLLIVTVLAVTPVLAGCAPDPNDALGSSGRVTAASGGDESDVPENLISGDVRQWAIHLTAETAKAGKVTFTMTNYGTITHEMLVVKTDVAPGKITVGADGKFNEDDPAWTVVDEISEFDAGSTESKTFDLEAGKYQIVCNIPNHYNNGMFLPFEVVA